MYEVDGVKLCLTEDQCKGSKYSGYVCTDENVRSCVTASQCKDADLFTWDDSKECISAEKCVGSE